MKYIVRHNSLVKTFKKILKEYGNVRFTSGDDYLPQDHPLIKTIKAAIGIKQPLKFSTTFSFPYSTDEYFKVFLNYQVDKISMWKEPDDENYKGTIHILITDIKLIDDYGDYDVEDEDEIKSDVWEELTELLLTNIESWNLPVDVDFSFLWKKHNGRVIRL